MACIEVSFVKNLNGLVACNGRCIEVIAPRGERHRGAEAMLYLCCNMDNRLYVKCDPCSS